jgi:hypothetical protein
METDWKKVYSTIDPVKAEIAKGLLREYGIEAVELSRRDSCYGNFGNIEVYCHAGQVLEALQILKNITNE